MDARDTDARGAGRTTIAILAALALLVAAAAWLWFMRGTPPRTGRNFFGSWRTLPIVVAAVLVWLAIGAFALRARRPLFRYLLVTLMIGATLALLEALGVARIVNYRSLFGTEITAGFGGKPQPNLELETTTYPDIASAWGIPSDPIPVKFRSDHRGYRNAENRDKAEIYLLGDSILVAGLLPFRDTVAARLEKQLGEPVMNLALIGVGPQEELKMLEEADVPLDGRVVIQFVTDANDLGDSARFRSSRAGAEERAGIGDRSFTKNALFWIQKRLQPMPYQAHELRGTHQSTDYLFLWVGDNLGGREQTEAVLATYQRTADYIHKAGGRYALVVVPSKYRVMYPLCTWPADSTLRNIEKHLSPLRDALAEWANGKGLPCLDLTLPDAEGSARRQRAVLRPGHAPQWRRSPADDRTTRCLPEDPVTALETL